MGRIEFGVRLVVTLMAGAVAFAPRLTLPLLLGSRGRDFPGHYLGLLHLLSIATFVGLAISILMLFN